MALFHIHEVAHVDFTHADNAPILGSDTLCFINVYSFSPDNFTIMLSCFPIMPDAKQSVYESVLTEEGP